MRTFVGILDGEGDVWGVRIPDAPGCFGGGATPEEAVSSAAEALALLLADDEYARALPSEGTPIEVLRQNPHVKDALARGDALVLLAADGGSPAWTTPIAAE
jgi:predicted RNase H-like HicB family nuclease